MSPPRDEEPEDEEIKAVKTQLVGAEKSFNKMLDKRNELNHAARERRSERDSVNDQKRLLISEIQKLKGERDALNEEARGFRERRNEFQRQGKELIEIKKRMRAGGVKGYAGKVRELEGEIRSLEFTQQSTAMTIAKENALLKKLGELRKEYEVAKVQYADEAKLLADVKDIDAKIDELFKKADEEHAHVVEISDKAQAAHAKIEPLVKDLMFLDQQSDQKHQQYLDLKAQADAIHQKMMEARDRVVDLRGERSKIHTERREIVANQNRSAREALFDETKLDAAADEAVQHLLSKKKIQL